MRKLVCGLFISLDGVVEGPDQWQFDFDEEMGAALTATIDSQDAILLGRVTYQEWAPYWPTVTSGEDASFADYINTTPKYVASTTLDNVDDWQNSTLISGNVAEYVAKLKEQPGKNIGTAGSPSLVRSLLYAGVVDELQLLMHPVIAGKGQRLITEGSELKRLELVDSVRGSSGTLILTYRPLNS
jgi:dihydrofolate reductase